MASQTGDSNLASARALQRRPPKSRRLSFGEAGAADAGAAGRAGTGEGPGTGWIRGGGGLCGGNARFGRASGAGVAVAPGADCGAIAPVCTAGVVSPDFGSSTAGFSPSVFAAVDGFGSLGEGVVGAGARVPG